MPSRLVVPRAVYTFLGATMVSRSRRLLHTCCRLGLGSGDAILQET